VVIYEEYGFDFFYNFYLKHFSFEGEFNEILSSICLVST